MRSTLDIIDALKKRLRVKRDAELVDILGCGASLLSNYRQKRSKMSAFYAVKAAVILKMDPLKLIAIVESERTKRPEELKLWEKLRRQGRRGV